MKHVDSRPTFTFDIELFRAVEAAAKLRGVPVGLYTKQLIVKGLQQEARELGELGELEEAS
jgi:hypothetical protein